jgi:hypothetical protein
LANAPHQQGERGPALGCFREAETMQAEHQPQYPQIYSLPGYRYCDLLLAGPERTAWRALWERKALPETKTVESDLNGRLAGIEPEAAVAVCLRYFDAL